MASSPTPPPVNLRDEGEDFNQQIPRPHGDGTEPGSIRLHFCSARLGSQELYHDSKSPCSAGKATHGAAAEPVFFLPSCTRIRCLNQAPIIPGTPHGRPGSSRIPTRRTRTTDAAGLSPAGLQPRGVSSVAPRGSPSLRLAAPLCFCSPRCCFPRPRSQTLSHDSKSPCSAGKATYGAAAECASPIVSYRQARSLGHALLVPSSPHGRPASSWIAARPLRATDAAELSPAQLQLCRLLIL
jgi:hypothetical protein